MNITNFFNSTTNAILNKTAGDAMNDMQSLIATMATNGTLGGSEVTKDSDNHCNVGCVIGVTVGVIALVTLLCMAEGCIDIDNCLDSRSKKTSEPTSRTSLIQ